MISGIAQNFRHILVIYMREYAHKVVLASDDPLDRDGFAKGLGRVVGGGHAGRAGRPADPGAWGFGPIRRSARPGKSRNRG